MTSAVLLGARGPYTIRRPRSRAPRVRGVAGASGATGPVGSPLVVEQAAGLFRCSGITLQAQVGESPPGSLDCSYARSGPIHFVVLGTSGWDCIPCFTPALGRADDVAAFNAATAALGQLLRWFERAERADRRGRALASLADALGRARAGAGASPRLRGCESRL